MACITDAYSHFCIWTWKEHGAHLHTVGENDEVVLNNFPEYADFIEGITGRKFKKTYREIRGDVTYEYNAYTPMNIFKTALMLGLSDNNTNPKTLADIKAIAQNYTSRYVRLLMREEKYGDADGESREYIKSSTKMLQFFNDGKSIYLIPGTEKYLTNLGNTSGLVDSVNKNFGINYKPKDVNSLTFGTLKRDVFRNVENQIQGPVSSRQRLYDIIKANVRKHSK